MRRLVVIVVGWTAWSAESLPAQADTLARLDSAAGQPPDCRTALETPGGAGGVDTAALLRCTGRTLAPALAAAVGRGADSALAARVALREGNARFKAGQASRRPSDFAQALEYFLLAERLASSEQSQFLAAVSAFQLLDAALRRSAAAGGTCADARLAEHYSALVTALLPRRTSHHGLILDPVGRKPFNEAVVKQVAARCG